VFYGVFILHAIYCVYMLLLVPESRSKEMMKESAELHLETKPSQTSSFNPLHVLEPLKILLPSDRKLRRNLIFLAIIDSSLAGIGASLSTVFMLYAEQMFHWRTPETSFFISIVGSTRVIVLLVILPLLVKVFRKHEQHEHTGPDLFEVNITRFGLVLEIVAYLVFPTVRTGSLFTLCTVISSVGALLGPNIASALTKSVPHKVTGQLLGAVALSHAISKIVMPTLFNFIYSLTTETVPQAFFYVGACLFLLLFVFSLFLRTHVYTDLSE